MKQLLSTLFLAFSYNLLLGQVMNADFSKLNTISQAEEFIQSHPEYDAKLRTIKPGEDLAEISESIFTKNLGYIFKIGSYSYKIVGVDSQLSFRVSYIYLDGNKYSKNEIDQIRKDIISKYKSGTKFTVLVSKYNMDSNTTGDTNWFYEKMMVKEFEIAVKSHKKGEIFTVDTPSQNWYHVVLKTYSDKYTKNLTILIVKSSS